MSEPTTPTAEAFVARMEAIKSPIEAEKLQRYFKTVKGEYGEGDQFMGVRMGHLFELAKEFIAMPPVEIEKLMESPIHEVRAGGMSIMDKQGRSKKTSESRRKELYDLYMRRHDRINSWDLVDLAAPYVVGRYMWDKPRDVLYTLARSSVVWERRTAMGATGYFIRQREVDDSFAIAEILVNDPEDLIHKVTGWMLRASGDVDQPRLLAFLDKHAETMPRTLLRYSMEHLDKDVRQCYLAKKKQKV